MSSFNNVVFNDEDVVSLDNILSKEDVQSTNVLLTSSMQSGRGHQDDRAKNGSNIVRHLIITWDLEVGLERFLYES